MRLCFVCHRAAPFPGGTEVFVQAMAEEALRRGHDVTLLAGQHQGDLNGVRITADMAVLDATFDLVVVHGATDGPPRRTLDRADRLPSPVLYQLVAHQRHHIRRAHLRASRFLGWSTPLDREVITQAGLEPRAVRVRHGIVPAVSLGQPGFRRKFGIPDDRRMFLSCGGYWPNKRMRELAAVFTRSSGNALLVTTGYDNRHKLMPPPSDRVMPLLLTSHDDVLSAVAEADCYLMHSRDEGFGLVLLEAMLNRTPWIAHAVGGATVLGAFGQTYRTEAELVRLIEDFRPDPARIARAEAVVRAEYTIARTLDDIEAVARRKAGPLPRARRRLWPWSSTAR